MQATLWIHGRTCRILLKDANGNYVDHNDSWNNCCSAEMAVMDGYPGANITFVDAKEAKDALNAEWLSLPV